MSEISSAITLRAPAKVVNNVLIRSFRYSPSPPSSHQFYFFASTSDTVLVSW